jgi:hypothetical protein
MPLCYNKAVFLFYWVHGQTGLGRSDANTILSSPLLSSPYASSVEASKSTSVGQRASLPTQRQGSRLATVAKKLNSFLDRLRPDRFEAHHQEALLEMFPEAEKKTIETLLKRLRKFPLEVDVYSSGTRSTINMPLYKVITYGDTLKFIASRGAFESRFKEQLATTLESLQLNEKGWEIVPINNLRIDLSVSLKGKTSEEIKEVLTHLPAIIKALKSVRP